MKRKGTNIQLVVLITLEKEEKCQFSFKYQRTTTFEMDALPANNLLMHYKQSKLKRSKNFYFF